MEPEPVARRTRKAIESIMMAKYHEMKEREKEKKEKEKKEKEEIVLMEMDDDEGSDGLKTVGEKRGRSDDSGKIKEGCMMKRGRKYDEDCIVLEGEMKVVEVTNWSSSGSDCVVIRSKAESDDIPKGGRSNADQKSGQKKAKFGEEVSRKGLADDDDIVMEGERPNPFPKTRPGKNWKRFIRSERERIEGDGMVAAEEGDQRVVNNSSESSGSESPSSEEDLDDYDYSAESPRSDSDSGPDSSDSDSDSDSEDVYSHSAAKEYMEDGHDFFIMRVLYVGSEEAFRQGKGSVMMVNSYDAMDMDGFVEVDGLYEKREKGSEKMRLESSVHSRSDEDVLNKKLSKKAEKKKLYKKRTPVENIKNAINLLLAKTLSEEDGVSGDLGASFDKVQTPTGLPMKFRFEEPAPPPEKEPWEIETDNLFAEMHMCLAATYSAEDNAPSSKVAEETEESLSKKSPMERCRLGYHDEVLEEPIGIICRCCQVVLTEMKYIFPDLITRYPRRRDSFFLGKDDLSEYNHDYIPSGDSVSESYISSIQAEGSVLELIPPKTRPFMFQHQLDGFVFLWKNVVGETSLEKLKEMQSVQGSGCIISHAPGTGKTFLSIVFIMTLMRSFPYPECRPMIVAPKSMLLTWQKEIEKWDCGFPFHNLNSDELSGKEIEVAGLDRVVSREKGGKLGKKCVRKLKLCSWMRQRSILGVSYTLFEKFFNGPEKDFLLEKPGLVVLDEGHTPRNNASCIWKALKELKTRKRIILSGTPFQNSFKELQTTLHLMNPDFSSKSDLNWKNLKSGKENEDHIAKLKAMIKPLVHVHKGTILQEMLPGLKDMLVILKPTTLQKRAFEAISSAPNQFEKVHLVSLASVHPSLARTKEFLKIKPDLDFLDNTDINLGVKTKFVLKLVKFCNALGEKVLIFSEFIGPLKFLKKKFKEELSWMEGRQVLYMDGQQEAKIRQASITSLNDPDSEVKVLLASTKACSEGIHLVGASRVVLLDVVWNPSVERQAISRAFRLGQKRIVHVYHLITAGTLEMHKYEMQTRKHRLAELVFSSRDMESKTENINAAVREDLVLGQMMDDKTLKDIFEEIVHNPKP